MKSLYWLAAMTVLFAGCGTGSDGKSGGAAEERSGVFLDGKIQGLGYRCASGKEGEISRGGYFACPADDRNVTVLAGSQPWMTFPMLERITLESVRAQAGSGFIERMRQLLGADADHNLSNGIDIDPRLFGQAEAGLEETTAYLQAVFSFEVGGSSFSHSVASVSQSSEGGFSESESSETGTEAVSAAVQSSEGSGAETDSASSQSSSVQSSQSSASSVSSAVFPEAPYSIGSGKSKYLYDGSGATVAAASSSAAASVQNAPPRPVFFREEAEPKNWYVRLRARIPAWKLATPGASLGELDRADALRNNSLRAMPAFSGTYLDIVFKNPDGLAPGEYNAVYRPYRTGVRTWEFTVKTSAADAEVLISWTGLYLLTPYTDAQGRIRYEQRLSKSNPLLQKMQIVDEATGEKLPAVKGAVLPVFRIEMNGRNSRTFRWEVLTHNVNVSAPSAAPVRVFRSGARHLIQHEGPVFDLSSPPSFGVVDRRRKSVEISENGR